MEMKTIVKLIENECEQYERHTAKYIKLHLLNSCDFGRNCDDPCTEIERRPIMNEI